MIASFVSDVFWGWNNTESLRPVYKTGEKAKRFTGFRKKLKKMKKFFERNSAEKEEAGAQKRRAYSSKNRENAGAKK